MTKEEFQDIIDDVMTYRPSSSLKVKTYDDKCFHIGTENTSLTSKGMAIVYKYTNNGSEKATYIPFSIIRYIEAE